MSVIRWFDKIDSTNNQIVKDKLRLDDKSVYAALYQSAGRGQRGNSWYSRSGENLLFTILFKPQNIHAGRQFIISQAVTLGIVDYLHTFGIEAMIKWPNDIYVGDNKICGILIENTVSGDNLAYSIVGIGLNVNQKEFYGAPNPTSIALETGSETGLNIIEELPTLLSYIFGHYGAIQNDADDIERSYLEKMYRRGAFHRFFDVNEGVEFEGKIIGIDSSSCLLVEYHDGKVKRFAFKEISYILK